MATPAYGHSRGANRKIYFGTSASPTDRVDTVEDVTWTRNKDELDGTTDSVANEGSTQPEPGLENISSSIKVICPASGESNAAYTAMRAAYAANTKCYFKVENETATEAETFTGYIFDESRTQEIKGYNTRTFEFKGRKLISGA